MANAPVELDDVIRDLGRGLKLIEDKEPDYTKRKAYYEGNAREFTSSPYIKALLAESAEAHPISAAHIPVDSLFDKVELAGITAAEKAANDKLVEVFDDNDFEDEAGDWERKAGYLGDYYAIIDPETEDAAGRAVDIKALGSSPFTTIVIYSSKDSRTALYGVKRWQVGKRWYANVYYDDVTVNLATPEETSTPSNASLYAPLLGPDDEPGDERIPHIGGRMLVIHYAVDGRPYGTPVHEKAFGPQDAITKISATNLATVDGQGFPSRWALQDPLAEIDDDIDDDFGSNGLATDKVPGNTTAPDGQTKATTGTSRIRTVPGAISILRGIKAVGQFDAATSENFLANLDWYFRAMAVATGTPMFEFDLKGEQPSGESRRRASGRINKHARKVKRALGRSHKALADTILAVSGFADATVTVNWLPTETETDKEGIELVSAKIKAGVPVTKALLEAGYTDEDVEEWFPDGAPHMTPELLAIVAPALAQLGQATTLGAITPRELADALPWLLTEARNEGITTLPKALPIVTQLPKAA